MSPGAATGSINAALAPSTPSGRGARGRLSLISKGPLLLSAKDIARVVLHCAGSGTCTGDATLIVTENDKQQAGDAKAKKQRTVAVGAAKIAIKGGRTATLKIALTSVGRRLLIAGHGTLSVTLSLTGQASGTTFRLTSKLELKT